VSSSFAGERRQPYAPAQRERHQQQQADQQEPDVSGCRAVCDEELRAAAQQIEHRLDSGKRPQGKNLE
jgi:hypothetical protein